MVGPGPGTATASAEQARVGGYVTACAVAAATLLVVAFLVGGVALPPPLTLAVLTLVSLVASRLQFSFRVRGIGGVVEIITVGEFVVVLALVFLSPGWAVAVVTGGALVVEALERGQPLVKTLYNVSSEALAMSAAVFVHLATVGTADLPATRAVLAACLGVLAYIATNTLLFAGLASRLTGARVGATLRDGTTASGLAVSVSVAAAGVVGAVLAVVAPAALPLLAAPVLFDRMLAHARHDRLVLAADKSAAEAASGAKSEFLSGMSHELRTPLNAVLGFGQLLESDPDAGVDQREYAGLIVQSGRHLLRVIEDALDLTRVEAGHLHLDRQPVDVADLATQVLALLRPLADQREVSLHLEVADDLPPASADAHRLRQVLLNLGANAVKYNRDGGQVTVRITADPPADGAALRIDVDDTGPGIAAEDLPRLFVPFERLHARRADVEGTGLGLSVSRQLVESMGGALSVTSELDRGSTFTVSLPADRRSSPVGLPAR